MYEHGKMNIEQQNGSFRWFVWLFTYGAIFSAFATAFVVYIQT